MKPLVSIGMAIYNEQAHLAETLECLLRQEYPNIELLISDNASNDGTKEICLRYAAKDSRIKYCPLEKTITASKNFNRVFRLSRGEYFMWAAGHDRYEPTFISACLNEMAQDPSVVLCYPIILAIAADGKPLKRLATQVATQGIPGPLVRCLLTFWHLGGYEIQGLLRAEAVKRTRLLVSNTIGPDLIFLCELSLQGTFACLHSPLYHNRQKWISGTSFEDTLSRYSERKYFWDKDSLFRLPSWRWLYEYLRAFAGSPIGLRRKTILIPAVMFLFTIRNFRMMMIDLGRPWVTLWRIATQKLRRVNPNNNHAL